MYSSDSWSSSYETERRRRRGRYRRRRSDSWSLTSSSCYHRNRGRRRRRPSFITIIKQTIKSMLCCGSRQKRRRRRRRRRRYRESSSIYSISDTFSYSDEDHQDYKVFAPAYNRGISWSIPNDATKKRVAPRPASPDRTLSLLH